MGVYWIKNEARFIEKSLKSVMEICSEIIVMDNNSTDDTVEICSGFDKVTEIIKRKDLPLDEVRDKNIIYEHARKSDPDFILAVDGDEIFMPNASEILFEELSTIHPNSDVLEFQFLTLWDNVNTIRTDGIFGYYWQKRLLRMKNQPYSLLFVENDNPGNIHCGSIPPSSVGFDNQAKSNVKIFHLASLDDEVRQRKYGFYTKTDPDNVLTGAYKHMISGEGKFSGPNGIELEQLPKEFTVNL
mgnify:FL=1